MSRFLVQTILILRAALLRLAALVTPPGMVVLDNVFGMARTRLLELAVDLNVAFVLERDGPLGPHALSGKVKADPEALGRALRTLASSGIFTLHPDGRFANNRVSRSLIPGRRGSVARFVSYFASEANTRAWSALASSVETGKSAFIQAHGIGVWDHFKNVPEEGTQFGLAMRELTELEAATIARGYPFSAFKSVCDVGGGSGALLKEIVKHHRGIDAFVYDHANEETTAGLSAIRRVAGSFFDTIPKGPDAYLLKDVLHDWDDERALQILKNIRKAMAPGMTLLVIEMLLESQCLDPAPNLADIHMLVACGGKQRSAIDMEKLLRETGFSIDRIIGLQSTYSIVEARAEEAKPRS